MLPYQRRRPTARIYREVAETELAKVIQQQHPEWNWYQCLSEAKRDLASNRRG